MNGRTKYYLAHAYRKGSRVRKVRVFLGTDLGEGEAAERAKAAATKLEHRVAAAKELGDPYRTLLSPDEAKELTLLTTRVKVKLAHLSEVDWKNFTEEFTYATNAIEGSTVSKREVRQVLEDKEWPARSREEISETLGVAEAVRYIRRTKEVVSLPLVKELHRIVFKNSKPFAGETRKKSRAEVAVVDAGGVVVHRGAPARQVDSLLIRLAKWYRESAGSYPPLVLAAVVHNQFESIHPFEDGNGRVGRLLLVNGLIKHGLPPLNIELENRKEYYLALREYQSRGNLRPTIDLMLKEYRRLKGSLKR